MNRIHYSKKGASSNQRCLEARDSEGMTLNGDADSIPCTLIAVSVKRIAPVHYVQSATIFGTPTTHIRLRASKPCELSTSRQRKNGT